MRLGIGQVDTRLGDLSANCAGVREATAALAPGSPDLVVFPELVSTGYPPRDLLLDPAFVDAALAAQQRLAWELRHGPPVVLGGIARAPASPPGHPGLYNAALVCEGGELRATVPKQLLPAYDVFHEPRWFLPGPPGEPLDLAGRRVGLLICEDLWEQGYTRQPATTLREQGAELLLCLNASPFRRSVLPRRLAVARAAGLPVAYVNAVGAHDELIFDGASFALDASGQPLRWLPRFREAVDIVDLDAPAWPAAEPPDDLSALWQALVSGLRGFAAKNGLRRAVVGLSGGIDSALVAVLAADALGPRSLSCVALPSRYTDPRSTAAAEALAATLGCALLQLPLEPLHAAAEATLAPHLDRPRPGDSTLENVQARLRTVLLMGLVNHRGGMLLNTSNKTELALGYTTLYGDMAGAVAPIGDLDKATVRALACWASDHVAEIPAFVLSRPPSAELRPDQVDPFDYATLAPRLEQEILARAGHGPHPEPALAPEHLRALRGSEHKRWQATVVLKINETAFGTGRMVPITRA